MSTGDGQEPPRFPVQMLRPVGGEIYGVLFENPGTGLPLDVYWSFRVEFSPFRHAGEELCCNLMADWVRLPVRDWRGLLGQEMRGNFDQIEASFYTLEHDPALETEIRVLERKGTEFRIAWSSLINYEGLTPEEADPRLPVSAEAWVRFTGIIVSGRLLPNADGWREQASRLLGPFVDLSRFGSIERANNEFGVLLTRLPPGMSVGASSRPLALYRPRSRRRPLQAPLVVDARPRRTFRPVHFGRSSYHRAPHTDLDQGGIG